jgi:2-polyprenyl-3-methyl-5-hydroxy-6-metoxy-1,4-benzoquinol methylase
MRSLSVIRRRFDRRYFESVAYREIADSQRNRKRLQEITSHKKGGKLLEVGCGQGGLLRLASRHFDVHGIDISSYAIACIKPTFGDQVWRGDVENGSFSAAHYDVILAFNVLEHLEDPGAVIKRIYDSLTDGGVFVGSVPNNSAGVGMILTRFANAVDRTHRFTYPPTRWRTLFRKRGFRNIDFFGEITLGRNLGTFIKNSLWKHVSFNLMFVGVK